MKPGISYKRSIIVLSFFILSYLTGEAQNPNLPPTNLGIINMQDGNPPPVTGWTLQEFIQSYQSADTRDWQGNKVAGTETGSLLSVTQLIYLSKIKIASGSFGFTVLVPQVKISATNNAGSTPSVNPGSLGDVVAGPFVQWFDKRLFGRRLSHRLEADIILPSGNFSEHYDINPSAHLYSTVVHYTFTMFLTDKFAISMRHIITYNFDEIGTRIKPGMFYNFNYSLEYPISERLRGEIAGYYLAQLIQNSYNGNYNFYQQNFGIPDTKERAFALGPGLSYLTLSGLFLEIKGMQETAVKNRTQGFRTALGLSYTLGKH